MTASFERPAQEWLENRRRYNRRLMDTVLRKPVNFNSSMDNKLVFRSSVSTEQYLDFFCDVGTASLGYGSIEQEHVLRRMIDNGIPFHAPNLFGFEERDLAADELCDATDMERVFFCNSGTEAVEAAIKLARKFPSEGKIFNQRKTSIWSYNGSFHGRTYGALAAGDGPKHHYKGFGQLPPDFYHFTALDEIDFRFAAAVILAPVFGNGDVREYPMEFLYDLQERCRQTSTTLIFDEVQTGSGRSSCAAMTYAQDKNLRPDVITLAKGLGMGMPVGAMLARGPVASAFTPGSHFSTFGGNPISCVAIRGMLAWLRSNMDQRSFSARTLRDELEKLPWVKKLRGPNMLLAFDTDVCTMKLAEAALEHKLLIGAFHPGPGVVKITPPLNITAREILDGVERLDNAYRAVCLSMSSA